MLVERVDVEHKSNSIVVGVISKRGREIISCGKFDADDPRVPDGETIYEIGSITKVFTALLLSDMALRGEVKLNDPVSKYLPASVHMPTRNGKQITLLDLATHHSGLPVEPPNISATYSADQMYDFLSHYTLTRDPGEKFEYSNLGAGLLGHVLALRAGTDYETLLHDRITGPLQMHETALQLTPEMQAHLAPGHRAVGVKAPSFDVSVLAGAGAIRSNVDDMLIFLAANIGLIKTPLQPAIKKMLSVRRPEGPGLEIALGWQIQDGQNVAMFHNGQTYGYHAFIVFEPRRKLGVIILSNTAVEIGDIAWRILDYPVTQPVETHVHP